MPIELRNISKAFDGRGVLTNLTHTFPPERATCVEGPSGCGKTTLLMLIAGLLQADSGEINGVPERISIVFQEDRLFPHLSPADNLRAALGRSCPKADILSALEAVGLGEAVRRPARELSGGMRRRVAILRALLSEAPLLLMDEPFRGLDADTRSQVLDFARPFLLKRTSIIVTHDPAESRLLRAETLLLK